MGVVAMRLLREAMAQKDQWLCRKVVLQTELVIRGSCGTRLGGFVGGEIPWNTYEDRRVVRAAPL